MRPLLIVVTLLLTACGSSAPASSAMPTAPHSAPSVPPAGSCHARGQLPDAGCTPGAINLAVSQADIQSTICKRGWTATVRPPVSYTSPLKRRLMLAYGTSQPASVLELDHLISLELGGDPWSVANLWPEMGASPNPKDRIENDLNRAVCGHRIQLIDAQRAIAADWTTAEREVGIG